MEQEQHPHVNALKQVVRQLIKEYEVQVGNTKKKIQAVTDNDLSKLEKLLFTELEQQELFITLKDKFIRLLNKVLKKYKLESEQPRLSSLVNSEEFNREFPDFEPLRNELLEKMDQAQTERTRLRDLLLYAQEHVHAQLKIIYDALLEQNKRYGAGGEIDTGSSQGLTINKKV